MDTITNALHGTPLTKEEKDYVNRLEESPDPMLRLLDNARYYSISQRWITFDYHAEVNEAAGNLDDIEDALLSLNRKLKRLRKDYRRDMQLAAASLLAQAGIFSPFKIDIARIKRIA